MKSKGKGFTQRPGKVKLYVFLGKENKKRFSIQDIVPNEIGFFADGMFLQIKN